MIDGTTKVILGILAFAIFLNGINPWILPTDAEAFMEFAGIESALNRIADAIKYQTFR